MVKSKTEAGAKKRRSAKKQVSKKHRKPGDNKAVTTITKTIVPKQTVSGLDGWKLHVMSAKPKDALLLLTHEKYWFDFQHVHDVVTKVLGEHPEKNLFLFFETEVQYDGKQDETSIIPYLVLQGLLVPKGMEEPPPFLRRKSLDGEATILDLHELKFKWVPLSTSGMPPSLQGRVFGLTCRRTLKQIERLTEMSQADYEFSHLMDIRPSKAFKLQPSGKIQVDFVHFSVVLPDGRVIKDNVFYEAWNDLSEFVPDFCEEHDLNFDEHHEIVEQAIRDAFDSKRKAMEIERDGRILRGYNPDMLEEIINIKVYPQNMEELFPQETQAKSNWLQKSPKPLRCPATEHEYPTPAEYIF